jgi:hypothetical protein
MEKVNRVIIESNGAFKSERALKEHISTVLVSKKMRKAWGLKIKGFNATTRRKAKAGHHSRGGLASAKLLTPAQRSLIASKAAKKRWKAYRVQHGQ